MILNENSIKLKALREYIYFLNLLPDNIYFSLSSVEFCMPSYEIMQGRVELENNLSSYIMTYKRDTFKDSDPVESHLCANLEGALLTPDQTHLLNIYEYLFKDKNVSFVAYAKPLIIINPKKSNLFR